MKKLMILIITISILMPSGFASELEETYPEQDGENKLQIADQLQTNMDAFEAMAIFTSSALQLQEGNNLNINEFISEDAYEQYSKIAQLELWAQDELLISQPLWVDSISTSNLKPGRYTLLVRFASASKELSLIVNKKKSSGSGGGSFIPAPVADEKPDFAEALAAISDGSDQSWNTFWQTFQRELEDLDDYSEAKSMLMEVLNHEELQSRLTDQGKASEKDTLLLLQNTMDQIAAICTAKTTGSELDDDCLENLHELRTQVVEILGQTSLQFTYPFNLNPDGEIQLNSESLDLLADNQLQVQINANKWSIRMYPNHLMADGQISCQTVVQETSIAQIKVNMETNNEDCVTLNYDLSDFDGNQNLLRMEAYDQETGTWKIIKSWIVNDALQAEADSFGQYRVRTLPSAFTDIHNHWAEDIILRMNARGYIQGRTADKFEPDALVNRAEFATMLMNCINRALVTDAGFDDVETSDWFYQTVNLAAQVGIVRGNGNGRFEPNSQVTREDLVLMLTRLYEIETGEEMTNTIRIYYDMGKASSYAKAAINGAADANIITGVQNGYFRPKDPATRADALSMIERTVNLIWQ